ncbi:hypothetical protein KCN56_08675 [Photobacterium galatheae]|uniref:endonuclease/exonuclease/phosphatase family protein n=1 Tax=Photobacterium galatheae TaxID=1654360 RepID=UPI00202CF5C0|nr:endonuclease/exonuclease/phosphatase family protein [Photobacterium galatheae]MCM0148634.1 hypothetical protein [Photobacterium galatheae]
MAHLRQHLRTLRFLLILWLFMALIFSLSSRAEETKPSDFQVEKSQQALTIMSWNMEWFGASQRPRTTADYQYFAGVIRQIAPDIITFQEVDNYRALRRILPGKQYRIFLSDRQEQIQEGFKDSNQYTGFAVKHTLNVADPKDLASLNIRYAPATGETPRRGRLRYGAYIIIYPESGPPLHLLNVHLKSGCYAQKISKRSASCRVLGYQATILSNWISQRLAHRESFLISGDFNHRLAEPGSWLFTSLVNQGDDKDTVHLLTKNVQASCYVRLSRAGKKTKYRHYTKLIDHFVSSADIAEAAQRGQVYQFSFTGQDVSRYTLSDHCPLVLRLPWPSNHPK